MDRIIQYYNQNVYISLSLFFALFNIIYGVHVCQILLLTDISLKKKNLHKELPGRYHFSSMRGLKFLCLSYNNLSGQILQFLVQLDLHYWNISYNNFEGVLLEIGVFHNASRIFVDGNTQLSGGIHELKLPSLQIQEEKTRP